MSNRKLSVFVFLNSSESSFLVWTSIFLGIICSLNIAALCSYIETNRGQTNVKLSYRFSLFGLSEK